MNESAASERKGRNETAAYTGLVTVNAFPDIRDTVASMHDFIPVVRSDSVFDVTHRGVVDSQAQRTPPRQK